ncbi:MAG TPA: hypothetical protein VM734_13365 [Kofleriaceae bacterium]|nr:hypothetical protein [Kofleriaceae bacterium]
MRWIAAAVIALASCQGSETKDLEERVARLEAERAQPTPAPDLASEAERERALARDRERETADLKQRVATLDAQLAELAAQEKAARRKLATTRTEAERQAARDELATIASRRDDVKAAITKVKAGIIY